MSDARTDRAGVTNPDAHAPVYCRGCTHYFVTWDPTAPHGCRAFAFKSRHLPSEVVLLASGLRCEEYRPRPTPGGVAG